MFGSVDTEETQLFKAITTFKYCSIFCSFLFLKMTLIFVSHFQWTFEFFGKDRSRSEVFLHLMIIVVVAYCFYSVVGVFMSSGV